MNITKKTLWYLVVIFISFTAGLFVKAVVDTNVGSPLSQFISPTAVPTPFKKYEIAQLAGHTFQSGTFRIKEVISEEEAYTAYLFEYTHYPDLDTDNPKVTTGQINIPKLEKLENQKMTDEINSNGFPVVLMLRGFVSQEIYYTGLGSGSGADFFAKNGYVTISPDFLGYAGSDENSADIFESRFQTYTTAISLITDINRLSTVPTGEETIRISDKIAIWAHSNGGQIALTLLEVTKVTYPTTLWAPVTKGFPYAVLYYTDESQDKGVFIRRELAKFEELYEAEAFSIESNLTAIKAPVTIHQGTADDAIPVDWSNSFVSRMRSLEKDINYYVYPGADHNMRPVWDEVIARDLDFFNSAFLSTEE